MSDYQAIYDAVRSRISNGDVGAVIERVAYEAFDISHARAILQDQFCAAADEMRRPSVLYSPQIMADGTMWCALLGDDLQAGVSGFGETPAAAMAAFDEAFWKCITPAAGHLARRDSDTRRMAATPKSGAGRSPGSAGHSEAEASPK